MPRIQNPTISDYINQLTSDKHGLVTYLNSVHIASSDSETFTDLVPKLSLIPSPIVNVNNAGLKFGWSGGYPDGDTIDTSQLDFSTVTTMQYMFRQSYCKHIGSINSSAATNFVDCFSGNSILENIAYLDTSNATNLNNVFTSCGALKAIPNGFSLSKATQFSSMCNSCYALTDVPALTAPLLASNSGITNAFSGCPNLTDTSLNNILGLCISMTNYTGTKTLARIGITMSGNYTTARIEALSNYAAFTAAGWTIS